jgi:hypothetical protein
MPDFQEEDYYQTEDSAGFVVEQGEGTTADKKSDNDSNFIQKILEFFTGVNSEERVKQRKLKELRRDLVKSRLKFYNSKKDLVLPAFGQYTYEIYRMSQNFIKFFDVAVHSNTIKTFIIDSMLTPEQVSLKEQLDINTIDQVVKTSTDIKSAIDTVKRTLQQFVKSFTPGQVKDINTTYNQVADLSNLTNFDWYSLLHKFDGSIYEGNFDYKPTFETLDGRYLLDELISLNDYLITANFNNDWKLVIEYVKKISEAPGLVPILKKLLHSFRNMKRDDYMTKMIRVISKDPYFKPKSFTSKVRIVQDYVHEFQSGIQRNLEQILKDMKNNKINKLLVDIFQTTAIVRMKHYSQRINEQLEKRGAQPLSYVDPLNYIKAFLLDYCKGEIKPRIDVFIIKGEWHTSGESSNYSSLLEQIITLTNRILEFDNRCAEDDVYGRELKRLSIAVKHDANSSGLMKRLVVKIDGEAYQLLVDSIKFLIDMANRIKVLIDEYGTKKPRMIINLHQIKWDFQGDPKADLTDIYRKLFNFVTLLKNYIKKS